MPESRNASALAATIFGTSGPDILDALSDGDRLFGLGGADSLNSAFNDTRLHGGGGADRLTNTFSSTSPLLAPLLATAVQYGGAGDDDLSATITVTDFAGVTEFAIHNSLSGGDGDDVILAEARAESGSRAEAQTSVWGGSGNDRIIASVLTRDAVAATNMIDGGTGDDMIVATAQQGGDSSGPLRNDVLGGSGDDTITAVSRGAERSESTIHGGSGDDWISTENLVITNVGLADATNTVFGGDGDDVIIGLHQAMGNWVSTSLNDFYGGDGADIVQARLEIGFGFGDNHYSTGINQVFGGDGNDALTLEAFVLGEEEAYATNAAQGGAGNDVISAVAQADGRAGEELAQNILRGGEGIDVLKGEIIGQTGSSRLYGGTGDDRLTAVGGNDNVLFGGGGDDRLHASEGQGLDTFVFNLGHGDSTDRAYNFGYRSDSSRGADRLAFAGLEDAGAPGLLDDLDAITTFSVSSRDLIADFTSGARIIFVGGAPGLTPDSFADFIEDPTTQLILADTIL